MGSNGGAPARPKYSAVEIERRWLVDFGTLGDLQGQPFREIEDHYLPGTRLRLRKVTAPGEPPVFKLGKKYGTSAGAFESIVNIYLGESEYRLLLSLGGRRAVKRRYAVAGGSVDVYAEPRAGLALFEVEFPSEEAAGSYRPPEFARREITSDAAFSGAALSEDPG